MQISKLNSAPELAELGRLEGERDKLAKSISDLRSHLLEIGAIEEPKEAAAIIRKRNKVSPEGQVQGVQRSFNAEKALVSPEARSFVLTLREMGSVNDAGLIEALRARQYPYTLSGTALVILRHLRDVYKLIDFEGSPGPDASPPASVANTVEARQQWLNNRTYRWVATPEALAYYNELLKKAGREAL